ncbi:hypothetical protein [Rummeliibacillus suwonensis]|uniref:hypothetical protein n=1 Tax=Rummeliibacillus suwonensis TaxID=1306154 RepID=UPI0011B67684|nr:hypothetical protein [Rummeliibacillus suwonensis]MBO2537279.1 hypothetical protein [Rummeliibacillus suwonensis]
MRPIGSGQQDVGPSGVATGRGAFNLSSSSSVGMKKNPTDGSFPLSVQKRSGTKRQLYLLCICKILLIEYLKL